MDLPTLLPLIPTYENISSFTLSANEQNGHISTVSSDTSDSVVSLTDTDSRDLMHIKQDIIFQNHGYKKLHKICDTLQGELYSAARVNPFHANLDNRKNVVAIKKTDKYLLKQRIAIQDDINFCVSEHIIKEALILNYLTIENTPIGNYIVKYVDFFESESAYYLVMEYVDSGMNLKQFIAKSRQYIENGKLSLSEYKRTTKYLLWQLFVTVQWLHKTMHCCHLDLCSENIMLSDASFIETKDGISINPKISIKICDFGVAEVFEQKKGFSCTKPWLSIDNEGYLAPAVFNDDKYDARCADNWSLGIILFECLTIGLKIYGPLDMYSPKSGYYALHHDKLKEYLSNNNMLKYFNVDSFSLLNGLLNVNQKQRLKGMDILSHKWFKSYFKKYNKRIIKKFFLQKQQLIDEQIKMKGFPFYHD